MKIERQQNRNVVRFHAENVGDSEYLSAIIEYTDGLNKRASDARTKMHEANLELVKIRKTWIYRIIKFIPNNFSITKPRGCK